MPCYTVVLLHFPLSSSMSSSVSLTSISVSSSLHIDTGAVGIGICSAGLLGVGLYVSMLFGLEYCCMVVVLLYMQLVGQS